VIDVYYTLTVLSCSFVRGLNPSRILKKLMVWT